MSQIVNDLNLPIGEPVPEWRPPALPDHQTLDGRLCTIETLNPDKHAKPLFTANNHDNQGAMWTYLPYGPFTTIEKYLEWMNNTCTGDDPLFYAIIDKNRGDATGVASYMRINENAGSMEVGHLAYSPLLQKTPAATEAMFLMMDNAFELGYRRYEWKCNALNAGSRRAALRLGFSFEGIFRQSNVIKGRNRDTAWFAMTDKDWPNIKVAYLQWLDPANFDSQGNQNLPLSDLTKPHLHKMTID